MSLSVADCESALVEGDVVAFGFGFSFSVEVEEVEVVNWSWLEDWSVSEEDSWSR